MCVCVCVYVCLCMCTQKRHAHTLPTPCHEISVRSVTSKRHNQRDLKIQDLKCVKLQVTFFFKLMCFLKIDSLGISHLAPNPTRFPVLPCLPSTLVASPSKRKLRREKPFTLSFFPHLHHTRLLCSGLGSCSVSRRPGHFI